MGAIRKTLFVLTCGLVAPRSKKQKTALRTLEAVQGGSREQVARVGTRRAALGPITTPDPWRITRRRPRVVFTEDELAYYRDHVPKP